MEGQVVHFRRGRRTQYRYQMLVAPKGVNDREGAYNLIDKKVVWTSPGKQKKEIIGRITNTHGNKGVVRVQFEKGLPGQAIGTKVRIE